MPIINIKRKGQSGSSPGIQVKQLDVTENGTYTAPPDKAYNPVVVSVLSSEAYDGAYNVVPSNETQVLETKGLGMKDDIIIDPIPKNYGLITWNGAFLTVS